MRGGVRSVNRIAAIAALVLASSGAAVGRAGTPGAIGTSARSASRSTGGTAPPAAGPPSIHQIDAAAHAGFRAPPQGARTAAIAPLAPRVASPFKQVHGFHPYWMGTSYTSYDWSLLSTVAFFALDLTATGSISNAHGWPVTGLVDAAHTHGVRVIVTVDLFDTTALNTLLASSSNRQAAIHAIVAAVLAGGADGACVDFEGVPGTRKADLVTFLGDLRTALQAAVQGAYLSIATPAVDWGNAFDYDQLAARCDHLAVMTYDYHWANGPTTGPVSPLAGWGTYNVGWTVQDYVSSGAPRDKMLLGVPYYGYRWPSASSAPGAATTGSATALQYTQARTEASTYGSLWDDVSSTPWLCYQSPGWLQTWYDDDRSLAAKYERVWSESLAGVSIWALGYDGARPELWAALRASFGARVADAGADVGRPRYVLRAPAPNPFRDFTSVEFAGPRAPDARLEVHRVDGRLVRILWTGSVDERARALSWDGRDDSGRPMPSGVYVVTLTTSRAQTSQRVVRLAR